MRSGSTVAGAGLAAALTLALTACGAGHDGADHPRHAAEHLEHAEAHPTRAADRAAAHPEQLPGIAPQLQRRVPASARQVVAVYGKGRDSADSAVRLYTRARAGAPWKLQRSWQGHNGKRGWTLHHREDDNRSPVGVYTLTDAGGLLPAPDAKLPYTHSTAFTPSSTWPKSYAHDFDHVIAIDYNRVKGTPPSDFTRPQGQSKGGNIWIHDDHGSGTSACISIPRSGMDYLIRTVDPKAHPVVVMGDRKDLAAGR